MASTGVESSLRKQYRVIEKFYAKPKVFGSKFYVGLSRGVSRIFIIRFPTSGVGRYFNRGGEATSDSYTIKPWQLE